MTNKFTIDSPEVAALLSGVFKCSPQTYYKISEEDKRHYVFPIRKHLMALGMNQKAATSLLKEANIPVGEFIGNKRIEAKRPAQQTAEEEAPAIAKQEAQQLAEEQKEVKRLKAEEASISKRYSLVRQGSYYGVFDNLDATQVLFHTIEEAKMHLNDLLHGRDCFRVYYGATGRRHRQPELQEVHY
jgi:hypothetical protein